MSTQSAAPNYSHFGDAEIQLMESITGPPAQQLIKQSGLLDDKRDDLTIFDSAAGAGVVTAIVKAALPDAKIVMGDLEKKMVELATKRIAEQGWKQVEVKEANAQELPFADASFDYTLANFAFQLFPDPDKALSEAYRTLRPSGTLGYTAWNYVPFVALLARVDPSFTTPPPFSAPVAVRSKVPGALSAAGFSDIQVEDVKSPRKWPSADQFLEDMKWGMKGLFQDEQRNQKLLALIKEEQGAGEVEFTWEGIAVTAKKA
ncbi:hypothetical protein JCM6882_003354 [Rhodosporidiobolus microsporus]